MGTHILLYGIHSMICTWYEAGTVAFPVRAGVVQYNFVVVDAHVDVVGGPLIEVHVLCSIPVSRSVPSYTAFADLQQNVKLKFALRRYI